VLLAVGEETHWGLLPSPPPFPLAPSCALKSQTRVVRSLPLGFSVAPGR
jgi:hypothetical protein